MVTKVLPIGMNANSMNDTNNPQLNNKRSKGRNQPNINLPLFVLAGIKNS